MDKDEIISKLGWFTQMKSIPPLTDKFKTEQIIFFENIIHFLQDNGLTTKEILKKGEKPTDNTEIKIGDLTEEGLKFYLYGIRKWRQKYDRASYRDWETDRKSTRLNSSHSGESRMPSSA